MKLWDVIDNDIAEMMLEQHDRYEFRFGKLAVQRDGEKWRVYWRGFEANSLLSPVKPEVKSYPSLADALEFALSPRNQERLEEVRP